MVMLSILINLSLYARRGFEHGSLTWLWSNNGIFYHLGILEAII